MSGSLTNLFCCQLNRITLKNLESPEWKWLLITKVQLSTTAPELLNLRPSTAGLHNQISSLSESLEHLHESTWGKTSSPAHKGCLSVLWSIVLLYPCWAGTLGATAEQLGLLQGEAIVSISSQPNLQEHWKHPHVCETKIKETTSAQAFGLGCLVCCSVFLPQKSRQKQPWTSGHHLAPSVTNQHLGQYDFFPVFCAARFPELTHRAWKVC